MLKTKKEMARGKASNVKVRLIIVYLANRGKSISEIGELLELSRYTLCQKHCVILQTERYVRYQALGCAKKHNHGNH